MSLKFYLDAHIAKKIALVLRENGIDAIHCVEVGMKDASDGQHMAYATEHGYSLVSSDHDYRDLHWQWVEAQPESSWYFVNYRARLKSMLSLRHYSPTGSTPNNTQTIPKQYIIMFWTLDETIRQWQL